MKNPLKSKIFSSKFGYLAKIRLVIWRIFVWLFGWRLWPKSQAHALFCIFHLVRWCLVVDVAYELFFLHLDVVSGAYNVIIPFFDSHKMRPDIQSYRKPSMPDLLLWGASKCGGTKWFVQGALAQMVIRTISRMAKYFIIFLVTQAIQTFGWNIWKSLIPHIFEQESFV